MTYFLTSSPCTAAGLNPANGFVEALLEALPGPCRCLFICSDPEGHDRTDGFARDMYEVFTAAGVTFAGFRVLDGRNEEQAPALVAGADLLILAGGHVPTQNRFFEKTGLRELVKDFPGVIVGISAGTMNSARVVYAQPELPGEALDPDYRRFLPGLGLTETMVLPHYQETRDQVLDGLRLFEDITYPDSRGRRFYALVDGSYLLGRDGVETLHGEAYRIEDGVLRKISQVGDVLPL